MCATEIYVKFILFGVLLLKSNSASVLTNDLNIPTSELEALYALYNSTNGVTWNYPRENGVPWEFLPDANPCRDEWYGVVCPDLPPLHVVSLTLHNQNMSGTLPDALSNLPYLQYLEITNNSALMGSIPNVFVNMTYLRRLELSNNNLNGSIPSSLGQAHALQSFAINSNALSGPFPAFICNLTLLNEIEVSNNSMHGTIPKCIAQLTNLVALVVSVNRFHGSIPASLGSGNVTKLLGIDFDNNDFTGSIPASLGNMTQLLYIGIFNNKLSGPIPIALCNLQNMNGLYLQGNTLTGPLPACLSNLSQIMTLELNYNKFTGTVPSDVLSMPLLRTFTVRDSALHGSLPTLISSGLVILELLNNDLTGPIPSEVFLLHKLRVLELANNSFTGTIPETVDNTTQLLSLDLSWNYLTGTVPPSIGSHVSMTFLLLEYNFLHGLLPTALSRMPFLIELNAEWNFFSGPLMGVMNSTVHLQLRTILLNNNQFTGQLPDELFRLRELSVFAAVRNCFHTELTEVMCESTTVVTLALDGLRSGRSCRQELLFGLTPAYATKDPLVQSIPKCLFQMQSLTTLHLSGNGLTGALPANTTISPALTRLSLSHNALTGSIPHSMQTKEWAALDLSYNRLTGTLIHEFATNNSHVDLSLQNNRLSGFIPPPFLEVRDIKMFGSNVFTCNADRSNLPKGDNGSRNYHCASNSFDIPYYVWMGLAGVLVALCIVCLYRQSTVYMRTQQLLSNLRNADIQHQIRSFLKISMLYENILTLSGVSTVYVLLVLLPFYIAAASMYATYYYEYAWQVSAAFLSGRTAAAVMLALLVGLQCVVLALLYYIRVRAKNRATLKRESRSSRPFSRSLRVSSTVLLSWFERCSVYALFMAVSVSVVIGVNIAYVYVVLYQNNGTVVAVQILLAFFKLFWNNFCSQKLIRWSARQISKSVEATESVYGKEFHFVQLLVSLINNIAIPCLVVGVVSPSCLYSMFVAAPMVRATYTYQKCEDNNIVNGLCFEYEDVEGATSYHPPFAYSYQCSSSIITYYAPAFVFLCITATFITPASQYLALRTAQVQWLPEVFKNMLLLCVPKIMKPFDHTATPERLTYNPYFDANRAVILLLSYLSMLLTFGGVFPPLAVAFVVTIFSTICFIRLTVGAFLGTALELKATEYINLLNIECDRMARLDVLGPSVWLIVTFCCLFYTIFVFDTLGDAVGFEGAYWVLIAVPLLPVCMYVLYLGIVMFVERKDEPVRLTEVSAVTLSPLSGSTSPVSVEMCEVTSDHSV